MQIIYTYPTATPVGDDLLIFSDTSDTKQTRKATISSVVSIATAITIPEKTVSTSYGGGTYTGTSTGVTALNRRTVYVTIFYITNPVSPVNLNINGTGAYTLQEGSEDGWIDIPASGLNAGATYYLMWDGDRFQVNETNPESTSTVEFVNPAPVTATHGGITVGQTFARKTDGSGYSLQEMFDMILYPYQSPTLSSLAITGQGPTVEVGYTVPSGAKTFTWTRSNPGNIEVNSGVITDITASTTLATGIPIDSATSASASLPLSIQKTTGSATHKWQISGTNTQGSSIPTSTYTITWLWRRYIGNNASTVIVEADILALSVNTSLSTSLSGTYTFPGGNYKYLCIPTSFPEPSSITSGGFPVAMAGTAEGYATGSGTYKYQVILNVTNSQGEDSDYRVYRSLNLLNGSATFIVS